MSSAVRLRAWAALVFLGSIFFGALSAPAGAAGPADRINHVIVIYQENWSFDSLYGYLPGANGLANVGTVTQVDKEGKPYTTLPQPIDTTLKPPGPDPRFPANLPVAPFDTSKYVPPDQKTGDLVHRFYQEQYQIDGGKMDKFVAWSDAAGLVMSYYDAANMPEGKLAQQYTMADNFFHAAFGGSFLNHQWLICACSPKWPNAPASSVAQLDANGGLVKDGAVTPDGYAVNTAFTVNTPHPATVTDPANLCRTRRCRRSATASARRMSVGPGTPAAGMTRWPATPTPSSSSTTSPSLISPITRMARRRRRPT